MRKLIIIMLLAAFSSSPAHAILVSAGGSFGPGSFTIDTATGLHWLDLSQTCNKSMDSIKAEFGAGGTYRGLRYATMNEVATFYANAGISPLYTATAAEQFKPINDLLDLIGFYGGFGAAGGEKIAYGMTGTGDPNTPTTYAGSYLWAKKDGEEATGYYNLDSIVDGWPMHSYTQDRALGSFLVRDQQNSSPAPVPEPSTLLLLGAGLAGIALARRRVKG